MMTADDLWELPPTPTESVRVAEVMWRNIYGAVKRRDSRLLSNAAGYLRTGDLLGTGVVSFAGHAEDRDYPQLAAAAAFTAAWHRSTPTPTSRREGVDLGRALRVAGFRLSRVDTAERLMRPLLAALADATAIRPPLIRAAELLRSAGVAPSWTLLAEHFLAAGRGHTDPVRLLWSRSFHNAPVKTDASPTADVIDDPATTILEEI